MSLTTGTTSSVLARVPQETVDWLLEDDNPAVAALTRRTLFGEHDGPAEKLWSRRNEYEPISKILAAQHEDGSWDQPSRDYQKYRGSLWQIVFLGELWADGSDERVRRGADYAFSRQKPDGTWSANPKASYFMPCLTANVGRGLARMGWAEDERVVHALHSIADQTAEQGFLGCQDLGPNTLNGYCHMLAPKVLLFLGEVPRALWSPACEALRQLCVDALRDKEIYRSLPAGAKEFEALVWSARKAERADVRERYVEQHEPLEYGDKPGWLRFGFPLSYNSDVLEALRSLAAVGEERRPEYEPALEVVRGAADEQMRWSMRNSFNGKMIGDVDKKGKPSKWLTLQALQVLAHFSA